ncbi:hypothetical protein ACFVQB_20925 [Paenibacillus sp. NPDC057886]|uniref:hypothetical protein n=1 Tax=Paenibacillus sp. NPDC057886 TaxID=3346270 RepID=UPI00367E1630
MSLKRYQKITELEVIQFEGNIFEHTDDIFEFVGVPISFNILRGNVVELLVKIDPLNPLAVLVGHYIVKTEQGLKHILSHIKEVSYMNKYTNRNSVCNPF